MAKDSQTSESWYLLCAERKPLLEFHLSCKRMKSFAYCRYKLYNVPYYSLLVSGYLELDRHVFSGGQDFEISMDFRTDQLNALLLFTYNTHTKDYMLVRRRDTFKLIVSVL